MTHNDIVTKLWNLCDILRDDGINYSDYVAELVQLLFIKMEHEQAQANPANPRRLPAGARWPDITAKSGVVLHQYYKKLLLQLSQSHDPLVAAIYADAQTALKEPRHLEQLVKSLDGLDWFSARQDGLGDLYEGLLQKNATETKSGAGQYFTPRPLIDAIVRCIQPQLGEVIQDPAAGTAGFLIAADSWIKAQHDDLYGPAVTDTLRNFQRHKAYVGVELVPATRRLALMNCLLHGMEGEGEGVVRLGNSLGSLGAALPSADVILSNPPFGTAKGGGGPTRDDLPFATSNKQLAFLQHIYRNLKPGGRAAVVLPDNVLFEAGVGTEVRRDLMDKCELHTILRLPTGIFYAQGVKTNVLFFRKGSATDKKQDTGCTQAVWVYDLRTNMPSFGKRTPFGAGHLAPFEAAYGQDPNGSSPRVEEGEDGRWRCFSRAQVAERGDSLDISWLKDADAVDAASLPPPEELAGQAMAELSEALRELDALMQALGAGDEAEQQKQLLAQVLGMDTAADEVGRE